MISIKREHKLSFFENIKKVYQNKVSELDKNRKRDYHINIMWKKFTKDIKLRG